MITREVVNKAIDYIVRHIHEEISVDQVADYCHFSKFYFSRIFKSETGESVYGFIKRLKIERSAVDIKSSPDKKIIDIGYKYGYDPANYSTAFKKHHQMKPSAFKKQINQDVINHPFNQQAFTLHPYDYYDHKIEVVTVDDMTVLYERHIGSYNDLALHWGQFLKAYKGYIRPDTRFIERSYDDPSITDVNHCICDICMTIDKGLPVDNKMVIHGGKFAVYHFTGTTMEIFKAYQGIFNVWLPKSSYELDNRIGYDIYREIDPVEHLFEIDLYIPLIF